MGKGIRLSRAWAVRLAEERKLIMSSGSESSLRKFLFSRSGWVLVGLLAVAGYFIWAEHRAHAFEALPWVLLGFCVVMHLFMHGKHGGDGGDESGGGTGSGQT